MQTNVVASTIWAPTAAQVTPVAGLATGCSAGADTQFIIFSDPLPVDLCVYRGDSGRFKVTVTDPSGLPLDISAATWDCDVRPDADDETVIASLTVNPVDANNVEVVLDPVTSALLVDGTVWDLEMTLGGEVTTLLAGTVHVQKDVSRP